MVSSIVKITDSNQLSLFVDIIRVSFKTVAAQYGLTELNSPTNPAFTTLENLNKIALKAECFGIYINTTPSGFFAIEFSSEDKTSMIMVFLNVIFDWFLNDLTDHSRKYAVAGSIMKMNI